MHTPTGDKIMVLVGGSFLLGIILLSWIPRECPILRKALIGCPVPHISVQTPDEQERNRIAHQTIAGSIADFSVKSEENRAKTRVVFSFRTPENTKAVLKLRQGSELIPLATVTHPVLFGAWTKETSANPDLLLLRIDESDTRSIPDFLKSPSQTLLADAAVVKVLALSPTTYTSLESSTNLEGVKSVLLSHHPLLPDGTWNMYEQEFDLSGFTPENGMLDFVIDINKKEGDEFLLGNVHVDFRK